MRCGSAGPAPHEVSCKLCSGSANRFSSLHSLNLLDCLDFERDLDLVADQDSTGLKRDIPIQPVVLAIYRCARREGCDLSSPRGCTSTLDLAG